MLGGKTGPIQQDRVNSRDEETRQPSTRTTVRFNERNESPLTHWDGPLVIGGIENDDSHPCTSVLAANAIGKNVFIVGEKLATLRMVLEKHGIDVSRSCPMANFGRRNVSAEATAMMQDLVTVRPCLLWLQWSVLLTEPGRRAQVRTALEFFSGLVEQQLQLGGDVLLEARSCDVPIHDELFNSPKRLGQILNKPQRMTWCSMGIKGGARGETLLCGEHLITSNREFQPGPCVCQRQSSSYGSTSGEGYEQFCGKMLLHFKLISQILPVSRRWHQVQLGMRSKTGAR